MKKRFLALHALGTLAICVGLAWPLLLAMDIAASAALCLSCCAGVSLLFALGDCGKKELPYQVEEVRREGQYEKYWLVEGRLVGALLLGSIAGMGKVMPAVLEGKGIDAVR